MRHDPASPDWLGRDRFVLSAGHAALLQYIQLYLGGFGLELQDLQELRTWGSKTPGHPEVHHTDGVEATTGPLGQGLAMAVGMAMSQRDRKSTRLNSSHVSISYAVFCLKKKKINGSDWKRRSL